VFRKQTFPEVPPVLQDPAFLQQDFCSARAWNIDGSSRIQRLFVLGSSYFPEKTGSSPPKVIADLKWKRGPLKLFLFLIPLSPLLPYLSE